MAITNTVKDTPLATHMPSWSVVRVNVADTGSGTTLKGSGNIALGRVYSEVIPLSAQAQQATGITNAQGQKVDGSTVKVNYISTVNEAVTIDAYFMCQV